MEPALQHQFLDFSITKLEELSARIGKCLGMLDEERIWTRASSNENAIGNLVLHLSGNLRQWIISGVGGAPDIRQRDTEFAARGGLSREDLAAKLHATVGEAVQVLRTLPPGQLGARMLIQGYDVSKLEAVYHVVEHFSMHTGQVLFATKLLTGTDLGFYRHLQAAPQTDISTP